MTSTNSFLGRDDRGVSMVATLAVVVILGILATIALAAQNGPSPSNTSNPTPNGTNANATTTPTSPASASQESTIAACQADYQSVAIAIGAYRALNGSAPPSGTAWASSTSLGGPFLGSWPSDPASFTIQWNGSILSVVPARGAVSHGSLERPRPKPDVTPPSARRFDVDAPRDERPWVRWSRHRELGPFRRSPFSAKFEGMANPVEIDRPTRTKRLGRKQPDVLGVVEPRFRPLHRRAAPIVGNAQYFASVTRVGAGLLLVVPFSRHDLTVAPDRARTRGPRSDLRPYSDRCNRCWIDLHRLDVDGFTFGATEAGPRARCDAGAAPRAILAWPERSNPRPFRTPRSSERRSTRRR